MAIDIESLLLIVAQALAAVEGGDTDTAISSLKQLEFHLANELPDGDD